MTNYNELRSYYGPSLASNQNSWNRMYTEGDYKDPHSTSGSIANTLVTGAGATAIGALGFAAVKGRGGNVWDRYITGLRTIEDYSPGGILRTFQLSTFFSQFGTANKAEMFISSELIRGNSFQRTYLAALIGQDPIKSMTKEAVTKTAYNRLAQEGLVVKGGQAFWAQSGELALKHASIISASPKTHARLSAAYARHLSVKGDAKSFTSIEKQLSEIYLGDGKLNPRLGAGTQMSMVAGKDMVGFVTGGQTRAQSAYRMSAAIGGELVGRFNRLLDVPFEMEPFKSVFGKAQELIEKGTRKLSKSGLRLSFSVPKGSGSQVFGGLVYKYGVKVPLVAAAYATVDWLSEETLGVGPTDIATGVFKEGHILVSHAAQLTGLHAIREKQEEIAPGSTSLLRLGAFPLIGALGGATISYMAGVNQMRKLQRDEKMMASVARAEVAERLMKFQGEGLFSKIGQAFTKHSGYYSKPNSIIGKILRKIATVESGELVFKGINKVGPGKLAALVGAIGGAAIVTPFLAGAIAPSERPDELRAIYSGEQEVAIRKGRWWEFGRTPWEGGRVRYFRPHWYPRMQSDYKDKAIWGDDIPSPISKWFQREFTYNLEAKHYEDRPYPITSLPFEDVPLIGPLLSQTLGRIIKPPQFMHTDEWGGGSGPVSSFPGYGTRVATEIGESPGGAPISPYGYQGLIGEQVYRMTEMTGLPGFTFESMKEAITGTGSFFEETPQLESARRAFGFERDYWDLQLGGLMGTTEAFRRLYPHRRRQIPQYNPIRNTMPEWLPGPGEKSPDFLHGDPYIKLPEGELRLPGRGYAARFPELEDVSPEDYPLIHQYKILADVASYSNQFRNVARQVKHMEKSEYEQNIYDTTEKQLQIKKEGKSFHEYQYLSPMGEIFGKQTTYSGSGALISTINEQIADAQPNQGIVAKLYGGYWEWMTHNAETALDQLTPIAPASKFIHMRTAIEAYERDDLYGSQNAFWQHPIRDFIAPFSRLAASSWGYSGVPGSIQDKRSLESYFDILEYMKATRLANMARSIGDAKAVQQFEKMKDQTLFGLNPYTDEFGDINKSMPRRERAYFNSFTNARTEQERSRILEMVPDNMKALYIARWRMGFASEIEKANQVNELTSSALAEADIFMGDLQKEKAAEGLPQSKKLWAEFLATRQSNENYGDWYRRTKLLSQMPGIPGPDWVGWHPSVDIDDIKIKLIENMGADMHEYDLWPSRAHSIQNKPYINDEAIQPFLHMNQSSLEIRGNLERLLNDNNINGDVFIRHTASLYGQPPKVNFTLEQDIDYAKMFQGVS